MEAMNIIVGASGQVGAIILNEIKKKGLPVRAVVRNPEKVSDRSVEVRTADLFDTDQLTEAFNGGTTVFLLTPENPASQDIIGETKQIAGNYRKAIEATGIKRVVGLSCIGAHINEDTGNILMSRILEHTFDDMEAERIFIRPSYYFSNWLGYIDSVSQFGVLPSFFPEDLKIEMLSPVDLAQFIAATMTATLTGDKKVYELTGPQKYSSRDVATTFSRLFKKEVTTQTIPKEKWEETLLSVGFTENTSSNLSRMTQAVIDNKTLPEHPNEVIKLSTGLEKYMEEQLRL
jgi:uncharacterized protein YbjT (DUF2867 family)